ncbi:MAG: beta-phosphoglucomutase [Phycisphaerae bacterium]
MSLLQNHNRRRSLTGVEHEWQACAPRLGTLVGARPPTFPVRAVIFDVDGVLVDTAVQHTTAWRRLATEEGLHFDESTAGALRGLSRDDSLRRLLMGRTVPPRQFARWTDRKNAYYRASLAHLGPSDRLPGVDAILEGLAARAVKLAAASSSRNARHVLAAIELADRFDVVVDGSEVRRHKPAPDVFLRAARRLHVDPACCVVVEDAAAGIEAARTAGMRCVGVGDVWTLRAASLVIHSPADLTAEFLINAMRQAPAPHAEATRRQPMQRGCDACGSGPTSV